MAAALSIPLLTPAGQPFPYRNLILFITFAVILTNMLVDFAYRVIDPRFRKT